MNILKKRLAAIVMAGSCLAGLGTVVTAESARASAYGCTGYGTGISWQGVYVKNGTWCGGINGNGTYVNYVTGNFYTHLVPLNSICNFSMRADFYGSNGAYYGYYSTPVNNRCSNASDLQTINIYANKPRGYVNISLLTNGQTIAVVQHSIL